MNIANKSILVLLIVCFSLGQAAFTQNLRADEIKLADNRYSGVDYRRPSRFNPRNYGQGQSYGRPVGPSIIMPSTGRYLKRPRGINPKAASYYNQGLVKYGQGRIDQSIDWMKKAVSVDPRVPNAQYNIAVLLYNQGKFAEAKWWFQKVLRFNPGNSQASHWLSMCTKGNTNNQSPVGNRMNVSSSANFSPSTPQPGFAQNRQMPPKVFGANGRPRTPINRASLPPNHPLNRVAGNSGRIPPAPPRTQRTALLNRATPPTPPVKQPDAPQVNQSPTATSSTNSSSIKNTPVKDKWALIIGISKFQRPEYNLAYSAKDAQDFYNFLVNEANFKRDHVKLLLNENATRANIMGAFGSSWLPRVTEPGDLVVVYVSTHGTPADVDNGGRNYIVAYDTDANDLYPTGVDMDEIYRRIKEGLKTDRALIVLDTCYSGSAVPGARSLVRSTNFDLSKVKLGSGHLVISSSSPGEKSWESKRYKNGIFTHRLIEALRKKNKMVDVKTAFQELKDKVTWEVKCDRKKSQTPQLGGDWKGAELVISAPAQNPRSLTD